MFLTLFIQAYVGHMDAVQHSTLCADYSNLSVKTVTSVMCSCVDVAYRGANASTNILLSYVVSHYTVQEQVPYR